MITLAQFYATHRLPNAIVVPRRIMNLMARQRGSIVVKALAAPESASADEGLRLLVRRTRGDGPRGKKN